MFYSKSGFSVSYPKSWLKIYSAPDEINLLSAGPPEEGAVVPQGQAEIIVRQVHISSDTGIKELVGSEYHANILSDKHLIAGGVSGSACVNLEEIRSTFEIAPGAIQGQVYYFCQIGKRTIMVGYIFWTEDGPNPERERVAMEMVHSLKITK